MTNIDFNEFRVERLSERRNLLVHGDESLQLSPVFADMIELALERVKGEPMVDSQAWAAATVYECAIEQYRGGMTYFPDNKTAQISAMRQALKAIGLAAPQKKDKEQ